MLNPQELLPQEHPTKAIFKNHKLPISAVANYLGLSFSYVSLMLSGVARVTPLNDTKLKELAAQLEDTIKNSLRAEN